MSHRLVRIPLLDGHSGELEKHSSNVREFHPTAMNAATPEPTTALNTNSISQLVDFLSSVPPPLTVALVSLGPYISRIRQTCETISWRSNWYDSWLALAAWWAVCLLADYVLL